MKENIPASCLNELYNLEIEENDSFATLFDKFYAILTKYDIRQGNYCLETKETVCNTLLWNACFEIFKSKVLHQLSILNISKQVPKHLEAYNK